jgi:chromosome segregation ATPase
MEPKNEYRINKDMSARKNVKQPGMRTTLEVDAMEAAHAAYLSSITSGYEAQIGALKDSHDQDIKALKDQHASENSKIHGPYQATIDRLKAELKTEETIVMDKQQAAIQAAIQAAVARYRSETDRLTRERNGVQKTLDETKTEAGKSIGEMRRQRDRAQNQISTLKATHASEIAALQRKVAVEFQVKRKGRKAKTYVKNINLTFTAAMEEYCVACNNAIHHLNFRLKDRYIDVTKTLAEVCIMHFHS